MTLIAENEPRRFTAFAGDRRVARGDLAEVSRFVRGHLARAGGETVLVYDDLTGAQTDVDLRELADLSSRERAPEPEPARGRGRPKLGVTAREVTLLPRHWEWLAAQPGGASVALRRLVEEARRSHSGRDRQRQSQEAAYRFMQSQAGDRPGFEEALRALFAGEREGFERALGGWPQDLRQHAEFLAAAAWPSP